MFKKNIVASSVISIISSIFAFAFNIVAFYGFLIVGAFSSIGNSSSMWMVELLIVLAPMLVFLALVLFVFAIIVIAKTKKAEQLDSVKKLVVAFIVICAVISIVNFVVGCFLIDSIMGWFYILFSLIYILSISLCIIGLRKNNYTKIEDNKQTTIK